MRILLILAIVLAAVAGCSSSDPAPTAADVENTATLQAPEAGSGQTMSSAKATN